MLSLGVEAPPLAPELWNLVVVVTTCGFVGWLLRLSQLILTLVDVRFAVRSEAVRQPLLSDINTPGGEVTNRLVSCLQLLQLRDLGPRCAACHICRQDRTAFTLQLRQIP